MEGDLKHLVAHEKMQELSSGHSCTGVCGSREQGSGGPMRSTSGREPCWTHRISGRKPEPGGHQLYSQACYAALSHSVSDCATPWTAARQASLSSSPRVYTQVHRVGDASSHLLLCHPLLLPPPIPPASGSFPRSRLFPSGSPAPCFSQTPVQSVLKTVLASFCELVSFSGLLPFPTGFLVNFQDSFDQALHKVSELQLQHLSFQWIFRVDFL